MNEKTAPSLSGLDDRDDFLQAVKDCDPVSPTMLSANIFRRPKKVAQEDAADSQQETTFVNNHIVEVSRQDTGLERTNTCVSLIGMLRASATLSSAILPASLSMLMQSKLYPLVVQYPVLNLEAQPCKKIWVIIKAAKKSKCTEEPPYQVTTNDVEDVLDEKERDTASKDTKMTYNMITMCNKNNRSSLMLTPSHGKHVYALVVITAIHDKTLYAENVECLQREEKDQLTKAIRQEMTLAMHCMRHALAGKSTKWDETTWPIASSKCRALGQSPTGPELDVLNMDIAKKARTA
jgi:hypothetical protein